MNFSRASSLYRTGMKVRTYSLKRTRNKISNGWEISGSNLRFSQSKIKSKRVYYQLSFEYTFIPGDKVWFATSIPYTLCRLQKILKAVSEDKSN